MALHIAFQQKYIFSLEARLKMEKKIAYNNIHTSGGCGTKYHNIQ